MSLAWSEIVNLACQTTSGSIDLVTAQGMGRAYVTASSGFAFLRSPGILKSGLWDALPEMNADPSPSVLLTDLGNDLLYGRSVQQVLAGAADCVMKIRSWNSNADIVVTGPPLESVLKLQAVRFQVFKRLLFPFSKLTMADVKKATEELAEGVSLLAASQNVKLFVPNEQHYGLDPIHTRKRHRKDVFRSMFCLWEEPPGDGHSPQRHRRVVAQDRIVFGRPRVTEQPSVDSGRLKIYAY